MATIYNTDLTKELKDGAKIQQIRDVIPSQLAEKVVPVMEVNPKMLRTINLIKAGGNAATGAVTVYTTPTDRDFYLIGCSLGMTNDAACDNTSIALQCIQNGQTVALIKIPKTTLTACPYLYAAHDFSIPLKVDRNTAITLTGTFTVGTLSKECQIQGFLVENVNA